MATSESAQDERERIANARDRVADERDDIADQREAAIDARDSQLDDKEKRLANRELTLDERARALREAVPDVVRRQQEAIDRSRDVLQRAEQRLVRAEASLERSRAAIQRDGHEYAMALGIVELKILGARPVGCLDLSGTHVSAKPVRGMKHQLTGVEGGSELRWQVLMIVPALGRSQTPRSGNVRGGRCGRGTRGTSAGHHHQSAGDPIT